MPRRSSWHSSRMAREQVPETEYEAVDCKLLCNFPKAYAWLAYPSTDSAIDRDHHAHDSVTKHKSANCHSPAETSRNHRRCWATLSAMLRDKFPARTRLTNLPIGDSPAICHPVGEVSHGPPCSLGRRNRIKIGIGSSRRPSKSAGLLIDHKREVEAALRGTVRLADLIRLGR
jgi:hypothetical protein